MKALVMHEVGGPLALEEVADPACPEDGVVIAVEACGVCRSDHHSWTGGDPVTLPHIMGHEFAGIVAEVGPSCALRTGQRITAPFILSCGDCPDCRAGRPTICATQYCPGFHGPGAFAERLAIRAADFNAVPLPDAIPFEVAAAMGCRVTTAWRALVDRAALRPGEWVAVHGCGGVGLSALLIARALGARTIGIDPSPGARAHAKSLGVDVVLDAGQTDALLEITGGGAHVALDALGIADTFDASLRSLRKLGRQVQVGMPTGAHETVRLPLLELVYARQLSIHGMRGLGAASFPALLALVEDGRLDLAPLIVDHIALTDVEGIFRAMTAHATSGIHVVTRFDR
ncbi:MAG: alcohol dehydrogenase catalytic domain-containing protein [Pseudomonadota bacterium]